MGLFSSPKPPPPPDLIGAAEKTTEGNIKQAQEQTLADRPNQTDQYGNTLTWTKNPDGSWAQTTTSGAQGTAAQGLVNSSYGQVGDALSQGFNTEGLQEIGSYDMGALQGVDANSLSSGAGTFNLDPFGNSQAIQDATYGLLRPQREQEYNAEVQRLASQGITEDNPAFRSAMLTQKNADTDAQFKALLAGQTEYGNAFERAKGQNSQNWEQKYKAQDFAKALRDQQFGEQGANIDLDRIKRQTGLDERLMERNQPIAELQALLGAQGSSAPSFANVPSATTAPATDYLGATKDMYGIQRDQTNAAAQAKANKTGGMISLAGTAGALILI